MENRLISNLKISASSQLNGDHAAFQGRLHLKRSWTARTNDVNQWLQIDLGRQHTRVTGVATQGKINYEEWVTKYKVQYSNDGELFQYYLLQGQEKDRVKKIIVVQQKH